MVTKSAKHPIVGIGASAGGLIALESFFRGLPEQPGMGFVIVTHQSKDYKSALHTILARYTKMPVSVAAKGEAIKPNRVYVSPADRVLIVRGGRMKLIEPDPELHRFPIDQTLISLAEDRGEAAIGILLSGGGSDGTTGLRAIKEHGGITFAQAPDDTEPSFRTIPDTAVAAGVVDLVLPVEKMGDRLAELARNIAGAPAKTGAPEAPQGGEAETKARQDEIATILFSRLGHDFRGYKAKTFMRRVERRMQLLQIASLDAYIARLSENAEEAGLLFRDLLIGVTAFLRDPASFEALATQVIPRLLENMGSSDTVRIWVPACATGEEAYSIAILLREHMDKLKAAPHVQVFATDIDEGAVEVARAGRYHSPSLTQVSTERLRRFFIRQDSNYTISKDIRDMCVFSVQSVLEHPPFSRLDLISCRNLLIYFGPQFQARVLPLFHFALKPSRYLFLGTSENVSAHPDLFVAIDKKNRIFQRRDGVLTPIHMASGMRTGTMLPLAPSERSELGMTLAHLHDRVAARIMERFAPAHVIINREGDVLYYSVRTGKYLEPAAGAPSRQLLAMARKELRLDIHAALREALETRKRIERHGLAIEVDGRIQPINLVVEPFGDFKNDPLFLVVFRDQGTPIGPGAELPAGPGKTDKALDQAERDLTETRERLQLMMEEYETAVEELKSSNEELQSINEELQSANEELETSKEELQSVNEELNTVNAELHDRVEELDRANADLRNVFESTQVAIIFLDRRLVIRTFTPAATAIFKLISSDRGRPLTDIASNLREVGDLRRDIRSVFENGTPIERRVRHTDGRTHYFMRILPYRNDKGVIEGALIVFVDVTRLVEYEIQQRAQLQELNAQIKNVLEIITRFAKEAPTKDQTGGQFLEEFLGRIRAMTGCYDLLARANWEEVEVADVLRSAVGRHRGRHKASISLAGPKIQFRAVKALALSVAVHELADNAVRHGALSDRDGRLSVNWRVVRNKGRVLLRIDWQESGGPRVKKPRRKGFGGKLIDYELKEELGAEVAIVYAPTGVRVRISIPLEPGEANQAGA